MAIFAANLIDEPTDDEKLKARVESRIARTKKEWNANATDRDGRLANYTYREGDQASYIPKNADELDPHFAKKLKVAADYLNFMLSSVATVYDTGASRTAIPPAMPEEDTPVALVPEPVEGEGPVVDLAEELAAQAIADATDWFKTHMWEFGEYTLDEVLSDADADVLFGGSVAIEPRYVSNWNGTDVDGVEPIYYRRHEYEVLPKTGDPRQAEAVVFPIGTEDDSTSLGRSGATSIDRVQVHHYWDGEVWCRLKDWKIDDREPELVGVDSETASKRWYKGLLKHEIGFLPVVFVKQKRVQRQFHSTGVDTMLVQQCMNLNKFWTEFGHVLRAQHGYPWVKGDLLSATLAVDGITQLDTDGDFGVATPGANLSGMEAAIQRIADNFAVTFGMAPGSITMDPKRTMSGIALVVEQSQQEEVRQKRVPMWQSAERRYHRAEKGVYKAFSSAPDEMPNADLDVEHQRPRTHLSMQETERHQSWLRTEKLTDRAGMLRSVDPGLTEKQIDSQIERADADQPAQAADGRPSISQSLRAGLVGAAATPGNNGPGV